MGVIKKPVAVILGRLGYKINRINPAKAPEPVVTPTEEPIRTTAVRKSPEDREFEFISTLPGFLDRDAYGLFCNLGRFYQKKSPAILEIGIFCGKSFLALGLAFSSPGRVVGVDPFYENFTDSPALEDEGEYLEEAAHHLSKKDRLDLLDKTLSASNKYRPGLEKRFDVLQMTQDEFFAKRPDKFDIVHIDGEHTFQAVFDFFNDAHEVLRLGAIVIVDDFLNPGFPGISEAVHTHPIYLKHLLVPVFYGFNKAVFIYKPSGKQADDLLQKLMKTYRAQRRAVRPLGDGSVTVQ